MGLVDYSSSSPSSSDGEGPDKHPSPVRKKRKVSTTETLPSSSSSSSSITTTTTALPPLPASFHDLYASTVRTTTNDDPSLHQGRKRLVPHVAGNWPSHIYIEWHPDAEQHALLTCLVNELQSALHASDECFGGLAPHHQITSFLTSDLGSPLPLHISLSRPIVVRTEEKAAFLEDMTHALSGCRFVGPDNSSSRHGMVGGGKLLELGVHDLAWHRSPDSNRSFLVLRVRSSSSSSSSSKSSLPSSQGEKNINPELTALLNRCNNIVSQYGQPRLYSRRRQQRQQRQCFSYSHSEEDKGRNIDVQQDSTAIVHEGQSKERDDGAVNPAAFHVSIAWSFAEPTASIQNCTAEVFKRRKFQKAITSREGDRGSGGFQIPLESVKVKIGNVVTSIALTPTNNKGRGNI